MSDGELIQPSDTAITRTYAESASRGEVDMQVTTAKRYPRTMKTFKERALSLATLDEDTAASCFYSLPRGGKAIEGPSVRLAEIVAASWGNLRSQACIVDVDRQFVTAKGTCWDLENNTAVSVDVQRRITDKNGRRYNDDMIGVTAMAACSIALRNAIFKVVPLAMVKPIEMAARKVAIGDAQTLVARRQKMIDHFGKMGVRPEQIFSKVEKESVEDITLDDLSMLIGMSTAIKDGDTTIDECFPVSDVKKPENATKSDEIAAKFKKSKDAEVAKESPKRTSQFKECSEYLEAQPDVKRKSSDPETRTMVFTLPGEVKSEILIRDGATEDGSVDTLADGCLKQCKDIVEYARTRKH